jgi:uncharacterized protein (TIGR03084 family)
VPGREPPRSNHSGVGSLVAADLAALVDDLVAETAVLHAALDGLRPEQWSLATPAAGWSVGDHVSHLAYFDVTTLQSILDPEQFRLDAAALRAGGDDFSDRIAAEYRSLRGEAVLAWFQTARAALVDGYRAVDPGRRLPWYGPDMTPASSVTARLMETWAHGQDIVDALGTSLVATVRLRHVADLGIRAMPYSYAINDLPLPTDSIMVELTAPDGAAWSWGSADAFNRVEGNALDFCRVVTQRRHPDDTGLVVIGPVAQQWISIAQAFAGPAGPGRARARHTGTHAEVPSSLHDMSLAASSANGDVRARNKEEQ